MCGHVARQDMPCASGCRESCQAVTCMQWELYAPVRATHALLLVLWEAVASTSGPRHDWRHNVCVRWVKRDRWGDGGIISTYVTHHQGECWTMLRLRQLVERACEVCTKGDGGQRERERERERERGEKGRLVSYWCLTTSQRVGGGGGGGFP